MSIPSIFGTDGARGAVGDEPMTPQTVMRLAQAAGSLLAQAHAQAGHAGRAAVVIGSDTRVSADMLECALQAGFASVGVDAVMAGVLPTPAVAYLTRTRGFQAGVVVSASHNTYQDNGIKFFGPDGDKLSPQREQAIEQRMHQRLDCVPSRELGHTWRLPSAAEQYIDFCKRALPSDVSLRGMTVVIDGANGACHDVAPAVFTQLGVQVFLTGAQPDGTNINAQVGATEPDNLVRAVRAHHADVGMALDGDGDRLVMADASGRIFDGDALIYLLARDAHHSLRPHAGVVGTVMSNHGLELALGRLGVGFARAPVGDRHVMQWLQQRGWRLGGESSGHILSLDHHTTGDGIVAALLVLAAMRRARQDLAQLCDDLELQAQCLVNVPFLRGLRWQDNERICQSHARVAQLLAGQGRVLLRASGTEPVLRVMVECANAQQAGALALELAAEVGQALRIASQPVSSPKAPVQKQPDLDMTQMGAPGPAFLSPSSPPNGAWPLAHSQGGAQA